jgi:transposase
MENVVLKEALAVPVKHMDETGFRVNKDLRWLHVVCTPWLTHYRIGGRGDMLSSVSGVIVHDFYKSYYGLAGVEHALCGSHLLRELRALIDIENEPWAAQMRVLLLRACHATNLVRARLDRLAVTDGMTEAEKLAVKQARAAVMRKLASITDLTERRHRAIVAGAIAYHEDLPAFGKPKLRKDGTPSKRSVAKRIGHNLAIRLRDYRTDVLRFVHDLSVPFTNNAAERAIRMAKVKMKISGCFRSLAGAQRFATVRGFIDTARKRGWNILAALSLSPEALIERWFSAA